MFFMSISNTRWKDGNPGYRHYYKLRNELTYATIRPVLRNFFQLRPTITGKFCGAHYEILQWNNNNKIEKEKENEIWKINKI